MRTARRDLVYEKAKKGTIDTFVAHLEITLAPSEVSYTDSANYNLGVHGRVDKKTEAFLRSILLPYRNVNLFLGLYQQPHSSFRC